MQGEGDLLSLEPPLWVPDSAAGGCSRCAARFQLLARPRHHCRLCGQLFCHGCASRRLLLPPRFQQAAPQRVCAACAALLDPLQAFLAGVRRCAARVAPAAATPACLRGHEPCAVTSFELQAVQRADVRLHDLRPPVHHCRPQ